MKNDPIAAVCALALALMTGAVYSHWSGVDQRVALARLQAGELAGRADQQESLRRFVNALAPAGTMAAPVAAAVAERPLPAAVEQRLVQALERFEEMQRSQQNLRDQVAETNRDLMELQFQVDTHSQSFRPLNTAPQAIPVVEMGPGVLPPLETP